MKCCFGSWMLSHHSWNILDLLFGRRLLHRLSSTNANGRHCENFWRRRNGSSKPCIHCHRIDRFSITHDMANSHILKSVILSSKTIRCSVWWLAWHGRKHNERARVGYIAGKIHTHTAIGQQTNWIHSPFLCTTNGHKQKNEQNRRNTTTKWKKKIQKKTLLRFGTIGINIILLCMVCNVSKNNTALFVWATITILQNRRLVAARPAKPTHQTMAWCGIYTETYIPFIVFSIALPNRFDRFKRKFTNEWAAQQGQSGAAATDAEHFPSAPVAFS